MTERTQIDRRTFLRYGATATALAASAPAIGTFVGTPHSAAQTSFEWEEAGTAALQSAMASGHLSALELTQAYLQRIATIDLAGPQLNSIIETNPDAEAIAAALDQERASGHVRGPLHGIPIVLKDNIGTDDGMQTTAGSLALVGAKVPRDAGICVRLREAGAILLAKNNMSEWTGFRAFPQIAGWSGRAGVGLNPYALGYSTGVSSSGTAASVSANLSVGGIGTETYGSIMMPSSLCGVVGIKPTLGLTSRSGVIPIAPSRDVTGPIARTVADAATILGGMVGVDPLDPFTARSERHVLTDYRPFLDPDGLRGARLGLWGEPIMWKDRAETDRVVRDAVERLRGAGATVVEDLTIPNAADAVGSHTDVMFTEFRPGIDAFLAELTNTDIHSLADVVAFNDAHPDEELRWVNQALLEGALKQKQTMNDPGYFESLRRSRRLARRGIQQVMRKHRLDALIAPTIREAWPIDLVHADPLGIGQGSAGPHNAAGYPCITVPAGSVGELPVGLSFVAGAWSEPKLIRLAYAFEQADPARRVPQLLEGYGRRDFVER
jgi:amidase